MDPFSLVGTGISALSSIIGGSMKNDAAEKIAAQNIANQREFAQKGIQWKVQDAKAAGIHPLFALGASTNSFSNVVGGEGLGEGIEKAGQDIGRAVSATGDREARLLQLKKLQLDVDGQQTANDIAKTDLASRVAKLTQPGNPPPVPLPVNHEQSDPKFTPYMHFGGMPVYSHPGYSDEQSGEDRHGDAVDKIWMPFSIPADMSYSIGRHIADFGRSSAWSGLANRPLNLPDAYARWMMRMYMPGVKMR